MRRLLAALARGDLDDAREIARLGRGLEGGEQAPLPILSAFLASPPPGYEEMARAAAGSVEFVGRLEHDEVAALLPHAEALVMPSTFPEAFGMVAVEAAACGALPVSAGHSGMLEVSRQLAATCRRRSASSPRSRSRPARSRRSPTASTAGSTCRRRSGRALAQPWSRPSAGSGAGREWPAGCSRRPPESSTACPFPRASAKRHLTPENLPPPLQ